MELSRKVRYQLIKSIVNQLALLHYQSQSDRKYMNKYQSLNQENVKLKVEMAKLQEK
jgi:hypothetical protein